MAGTLTSKEPKNLLRGCKKMNCNIVLKDNENFILASCKTLEFAKKYLKDIKDTDKKLKKYYGWKKLPSYKIIKEQ